MRTNSKKMITFEQEELIEEYLNNLLQLNKSSHTIKNYRADIEKFFVWLNRDQAHSIYKINGDVISEYKVFLMKGGPIYQSPHFSSAKSSFLWFSLIISTAFFMKKKQNPHLLFFQSPLGVSSRRRHLSSLKNFFEYLKQINEDKNNKFNKNPVKNKIHGITLKDADIVSTQLIKKDEFKNTFEKSYRTKERLLLQLLYFGGLRLSEICYLKKNDFNIENKSISFIRKGGSRHKLYINNAEEIFNNFLFLIHSNPSDSDYLFHNKKGEPYSLKTIYNLIKTLLIRGNVRPQISPHSFRKACATNLYEESKDLLLVRDYLNHGDAKVTQTYIDTKSLYQNNN
jgi:integrase/recombinase XerC